ncbi:hypothetical protein [Psychroserpens burtonensis]|uniref:hypothetical protein n=1 Tax=Psychroserpens burtonensis TaxID=49278 RepID=UPI00164BA459|nr:hypothetical protein [Psychroserpens burtonensis]
MNSKTKNYAFISAFQQQKISAFVGVVHQQTIYKKLKLKLLKKLLMKNTNSGAMTNM